MSTPCVSVLTVKDRLVWGAEGAKTRFFVLKLSPPPWWQQWRAGQFVMLRPENFGGELIWARPFSIYTLTEEGLSCFIQNVGRGTNILAELDYGAKVSVWGPLGNGFVQEKDTLTLLLAGGMGIAPFVSYIRQHPKPENLSMFFAHRQSADCYPLKELTNKIDLQTLHEQNKEDLDTVLATIQRLIVEYAGHKGLALACGPLPFLRAVQNMSQSCGLRTQLSLENRMACGVGACLGCAVRSTEQWPDSVKRLRPVQVCTNGPVFWADQVKLA